MATKKTTEKHDATENEQFAEIFAGMAPVAPEVHYYNFETADGKHNPIAGIVLERRERENPEGQRWGQYLIATTAPALLIDRDSKEEFLAPKGTFALVTEKVALRELRRYLPVVGDSGFESICEVAIRPKGQVSIGQGRKMWKFDLGARRLRAADSPVELLAPATSTAPLELEASHEVTPF